MSSFDLVNGCFDHPAEFLTLLFGDRCFQILNLRCVLSHEYDHCDFRNTGQPRIAGQLRVERKQALGVFGVAACRSLPIHEAALAVKIADSINISNEFAAGGIPAIILVIEMFASLEKEGRATLSNISASK